VLNTIQLLDLARERAGIQSDYRLAQVIGVDKSTITHWRSGRHSPDALQGSRLAELAELDAGQVAAWIQAERAKTDEARALWRSVADRLARSAVAGLVAVVGVSITPDAGASILDRGVSTNSPDTRESGQSLYIMSTLRGIARGISRAFKRVFTEVSDWGDSPTLGLVGA
jgi:transcriptional regulator with XRE-family HTH domain